MLRSVVLVRTDVSEELSASFIKVTRMGELGRTLAVTSNRRTLRRNTKYTWPVTLKAEQVVYSYTKRLTSCACRPSQNSLHPGCPNECTFTKCRIDPISGVANRWTPHLVVTADILLAPQHVLQNWSLVVAVWLHYLQFSCHFLFLTILVWQ
jgi:hypothetical protein